MSLIVGLFAAWIAAAAAGAWPPMFAIALGVVAVAVAAVIGRQTGAFDPESLRGYARAGTAVVHAVARWPSGLAAAFSVVLSALGLSARRSGFVRLKLAPGSEVELPDIVTALGDAPDAIVVDADAGSVLAHVFDESRTDVAALKAIERSVTGGAR